MKHTIYRGEFEGRDPALECGVTWRVEIWRWSDEDGGLSGSTVGELVFDGDSPVEVEWGSKAKHEVIVSSTCTINVISPGDRTYVDLYTIRAGEVGISIYRNGDMYWTGTLDPEFYEEPYQSLSGYTVSLTFSDLGILDRLKYIATGMRSIADILNETLDRCHLAPSVIVDSNLKSLSTDPPKYDKTVLVPGTIPTLIGWKGDYYIALDEIFVRSDNFYDEDGEPLTMEEVVEGVLQPLALRVEQRGGRLYVYDLNGLYRSMNVKEVEWTGDRQTLGVDQVYNNATIKWSPYAEVDELLPDKCWPEDLKTDPSVTNLDSITPHREGECDVFTYHLTQDQSVWECPSYTSSQISGAPIYGGGDYTPDRTDLGFSLWLTDRQPESVTIAQHAVPAMCPKMFKIVPHYDGQQKEGIALIATSVAQCEVVSRPVGAFGKANYYIRRNNLEESRLVMDWQYLAYGGKVQGLLSGTVGEAEPEALFRTKSVTLPPIASTRIDPKIDLRITMEMLMDVRYNPYESADDFTNVPCKKWEDSVKKHCSFVYVPLRVYYRRNDTGELYVYNNSHIPLLSKEYAQKSGMVPYHSSLTGGWTLYDPSQPWQFCYLSYYDPENRDGSTGILGWKTNRQTISPTNLPLQTALAKGDDGQYIPYPPSIIQGPQGGELWIELMSARWIICYHNAPASANVSPTPPDHWKWIKWLLCTIPKIEMVSSDPTSREIETEDVEYKAEIHPDAAEDIEINTICGTKTGGIPTARGAYFDRKGNQITQLIRAGRKGQVEDLLIGTLYSQYAKRHTKIEGESTLTDGGVSVWSERLQGNRRFITTGEVADLQAGKAERTIIELSPDEYVKRD